MTTDDRTHEGTKGLDPWALLGAAPEAVLVLRDGHIVVANDRADALLGGATVGEAIDRLVADWPAEVPTDPFLVATTRGADLEVRANVVDGDVVVSLRDAGALLAGREAQERYRVLVEQIPAIVYIDREGADTVYVSPQIERILGVTPEEYCASGQVWNSLLHPDDRERIEREYEAFIVGDGGDLSDYRMLTPDGRVVWIRDRAVAIRDDDGRVLWEHGLMFDVTELKEAEAQIAHLAYHDRLTSLPNRALFEEALELALARAERSGTGVAVLYLDLDNFKLVNDSLGHHAGDQLLVQLAARLRTCTRDTDLVARQGGDEFLILLADVDGAGTEAVVDAAEMVADRVRTVLRDPFDLGGIEFFARGSIGISLYPRDAVDPTTLMKNADAAMYRAKRLEPGSYAFYADTAEDPLERLSFATRLRRAVDEQQWILHYQPIVDLTDLRVVGAEALVRWQDASGGIVPPGEFIPVAEELGLIEAIGDWVIDEMARQQRAWADAGLDLEVSFNLSPRQLWAPNLAERLLGKIAAAGADAHRLTVEITESTAMTDPDHTQKVLSELHAWGLRLALDDFGTGYSSLARLKHMPVNVLKIDRAFVRDVDRDDRLARMVHAMIELARSLDMTPLAEGVETEGEFRFLRDGGCPLAQGFWFAKPAPPERMPDLIAEVRALRPQAARSS